MDTHTETKEQNNRKQQYSNIKLLEHIVLTLKNRLTIIQSTCKQLNIHTPNTQKKYLNLS